MNKKTDSFLKTNSSRIIKNGNIDVIISDIQNRVKCLPELYSDALSLRYGLGEYDPITESEIAEIFSDEYRVTMTEDLVSGILRDALFMIKNFPEEFEPINLSEELPREFLKGLHCAELTWPEIKRILYSFSGIIDEYLPKRFGDADFVIVPRIDSIYTTWYPVWTDPDGFESFLTDSDIQDYRGMAELIIEKLDKMGLCLVRNILSVKQISPEDIYLYAYLDNDLAGKIIHDNTLELIKKIRLLRDQAEKGEKE